MKTAISIPDHLYREAETLRKRKKLSRSKLYSQALAELLLRQDPDSVTSAMDRVARELDLRPDPAVSAAVRRTLERSEW